MEKEKALIILLIFYLIFSINFKFENQSNWHDQQRISQILFYSLISIFVFFSIFITGFYLNAPLKLTIKYVFIFSFFGLVGIFFSKYWKFSLLEWALILSSLLIIFYVGLIRFNTKDKVDWLFLAGLSFVCFFYLTGVGARYVVMLSGQIIIVDLLNGFSNIRFFGQFQTMTLPIIGIAFLFFKKTSWRYFFLVLLVFWWMLSFASGTRGTWLGMFCAMVILAVFAGKKSYRWICVQVIAIVLGLMLYWLFFFMIPDLLSQKVELINRISEITSLSAREVLWSRAWEMIKAHPWLGVGPMHFATEPNGIGAHPHNSVLQIAAEWGVPAALCLFSALGYGLIKFLQGIRRLPETQGRDSTIAVGLAGALLAASVQSLVDGVIVMPYSQTVLMLIAGWSLGFYRAVMVPLDSAPHPHALAWNRALVVLGLVLIVIIACIAGPMIPHLEEREQAFQAKYNMNFSPRFWRQGWIDQ